jgi:phosphohistidine phosphatase
VKRLLVLRHAKSSWADSSLSDWQRPLNERGIRDAPRAGQWLRERALVPDLIVTSDAVRARSTAEAVAKAAGYSHEIVLDPSLYHADPDDMLEALRGIRGDAGTVLIVGHNPGLEELVQQLTGEYLELPTAAVVHIALPINQWNEIDAEVDASIVGTWRPRG